MYDSAQKHSESAYQGLSLLYHLTRSPNTVFLGALRLARCFYPNPGGAYLASGTDLCVVCNLEIVASNGSVLLHEKQGRWTLAQSQALGEAVAVDWLDPYVILTGCEKGAVRLWDTRSRGVSAEPRFEPPIAVDHVRIMDVNLLVVAFFMWYLVHTYPFLAPWQVLAR